MADKRFDKSIKSPKYIPTKPPVRHGKVQPVRISGGNRNWGRK